jgi:hypothetical protein
MSYGCPPEQARLNRAWMPGRSAWNSEAFAERWQKNALLFGADQPGKLCAVPLMSTTGRYAPAPSPLTTLSPSATAAVGRLAAAGSRSYR